MRVPRLENIPRPPEGVDEAAWIAANKAWVVSRASYPADGYPVFAQGNAYALSWDLAERVAAAGATDGAGGLRAFRDLPDDVAIALLVGTSGGAAERVHVRADYAVEGAWTPCSEDAAWHFNIHPEHMYDLDLAEAGVDRRRLEIDVDGSRVAVDFDAGRADVSRLAFDLAVDHGLVGAGCPPDDAPCVAATLAGTLFNAPRAPWTRRCAAIPDALFCCG